MTAIQALEAVLNYCKLHQRWLRGAMKNPLENAELKEAMHKMRQGSLDELASVVEFIDEMIARMKKEGKDDDA